MLPFDFHLEGNRVKLPFLGQRDIRIPNVHKKKLDLYKLFTLVVQKGGATQVTKCRLWTAIVSDLGFSFESKPTLGPKLRNQ